VSPDGAQSILTQMKSAGIIDHEVVSFYTNRQGSQSYVKFGSMDVSAFATNPVLIGTTNETSWDVSITYLEFNTEAITPS
jgi:hypothetical protein